MDNLIELLTAGGRGGITGTAIRGGQLRREEQERREEFSQTLRDIDNKALDLESTVGTAAAKDYLTAAKNAEVAMNSAAATVQRADAKGRSDYIARLQMKASSDTAMANYLGDLAEDERANVQNMIAIEQINASNAKNVMDISEEAMSNALKRIDESKKDIAAIYYVQRMSALKSGNATELARIDELIEDEVTARNVENYKILEEAQAKLGSAVEMVTAQSSRLRAKDFDLGPEVNAAITKEINAN